MKKIPFTLLILLGIYQGMNAQNIGINSTGATPDASAMLDIASTTKGLLIPRVALTATNAAGPITSPATSLLVYNTATAGTSPNNVVPGYYYWNGTAWVALLSSSTSNGVWTLSGNAGTTAGTNFIGTTDAVDLVIKTNNTEQARITSDGSLAIGTSAPDGEKVLIDAGTSQTGLSVVGELDDYLEINVQNFSNGNFASSDIVATANNGTDNSVYIDVGINSAGYNNGASNILNGANVAYLYSNANDLKIGNGTPGRNLIFFTNPVGGTLGTNTANGLERMRITSSGTVGIGTNNPNTTYLLHVNGDAAKPGGGSWASASDRRLKKDITPFTDGLTVLNKIRPVWYKFNGMAGLPNDGKNYVGIIAQEMKEAAPYTVGTFRDAETNSEYYNYDATAVTYILINAVKEQQATIESLKKQLEEQNQRLTALENKLK
jgi:hypothetical protein